jgi:antitoxin (DNA-binding transcriptional repressor) of toxin-antitoxin stability system
VKENVISVTEAARNFADCVNRAHYQNVTFVLLKNGRPFARLVPENTPENAPNNAKVCSGRALAEALAKAKLPKESAKAWRRDLQTARKPLRPPSDKW